MRDDCLVGGGLGRLEAFVVYIFVSLRVYCVVCGVCGMLGVLRML
jgi:hypothetical protein